MAHAMPPASEQEDDTSTIVELIFSCSICQATPSEVYAIVESNHGFSGTGRDDGVVTKIWIAECSHVTCSKHLPDGAIPFHPKGQPPQAPCPRCIVDRGDHEPKQMYSLRGLGSGERDSIIPDEWFQCPPMKLDTNIPGMEAVRFQYSALSTYARQARKHWKDAERKLSSMKAACSQAQKNERQAQAEVLKLRDRVASLEKSESNLKKWEARKGIINHYLNQVGDMAKEIAMLRNICRRAGYPVSGHNFTFDLEDHSDPRHEPGYHQYGPPSNELPMQAARASEAEYGRFEKENSSSARKRKRDIIENAGESDRRTHTRQYQPRGSSRDLMPPPLPRQKASYPPLRPQAAQDKLQYAGSLQLPDVDHRNELALNTNDADTRLTPFTYQSPAQLRNSYDARITHSRYGLPILIRQGPSQVSTFRKRDIEYEHLPQQDSHDAQSFSRLSSSSPQKGRATLSSRITGYDSACGTVAQRADVHPRRERLPTGASRTVRPTPSPRKSNGPTASVISPFFKRDLSTALPSTAHRPPARDGPIRSEYGSRASHHPARGYQVPTGRGTASHSFDDGRSMEAPSFVNRIQRSNDYQRTNQMQNHHPPSEAGNFQLYRIPRPSQNSSDHLSRPGHAAASMSQAAEMSSSNFYTGDLGSCLPPVAHDRELSHIQGVRGVSSHKGQAFKYPAGTVGRPDLFSSAEVRRSVHR